MDNDDVECFTPRVPNSEELGEVNVNRDLTLMRFGTTSTTMLILTSQVPAMQANGWIIEPIRKAEVCD